MVWSSATPLWHFRVERDYLDVRGVLDEPLVAALPESYRLAARENRPRRTLGKCLVPFPRCLGLSFYDLAVDACRGAGFKPKVGQETTHMQTIVGLVAAGAGVSLISASVAEHPKSGVAH